MINRREIIIYVRELTKKDGMLKEGKKAAREFQGNLAV